MRYLLFLLPVFLFASCDRTPNTPEGVAEAVLTRLAAKDVDGAAKFFADEASQRKWFDMYYGEQPIERLFDGSVGNVFVNGDEAVVTYSPSRTLFNSFGDEDLMILKMVDGQWKADLKSASHLRNAVNGGGIKTNLSIVGDCLQEAEKKLGRTPETVEEIVENLEIEGAKSSVRGYTRMFDYYPEGETIDGVSGVIFYSKEPYRHGMYIGATKERLFLSGDGEVVIDEVISLM